MKQLFYKTWSYVCSCHVLSFRKFLWQVSICIKMLIFHKTLHMLQTRTLKIYQYFYISRVQDDKQQVWRSNLDPTLSNIIFPVTYSLTSPPSGVYGRSGAVGKRIFRCGSWTSFISRNLSHSQAPSPVSPAIDHNRGILFKLTPPNSQPVGLISWRFY